MFVTSNPTALPATCLRCPGSHRERYIDTDITWEFHGAVYLCDECVIEMGWMMGMLSQSQADDLINSNSELQKRNFDLQRRVAGLEAAIRGLAHAGFESVPERRDSPVLFPDIAGQGEFPGLTSGEVPGTGDLMGTGTGTNPEQSDDEQLDGVRPVGAGGGGDFRLSL